MADNRGEGGNDGPAEFATFIVRVARDSAGSMSGVVEWVRTGERTRFHGLAEISEVIARMLKQTGSWRDWAGTIRWRSSLDFAVPTRLTEGRCCEGEHRGRC